MLAPIKVCVTGGAGQIAYSLLLHVANGNVFGPNQPLILHLLDIEQCLERLHGVVMELEDLALPLITGVIATAEPKVGFADIDVALLLGAFPGKKGEITPDFRKDLLRKNNDIFIAQGRALDAVAKKSVKVVVVGNPCNTNALTCMTNAPSIPRTNFTCLTRLDQNRARYMLAKRLEVSLDDVKNVIIWGNHSGTQFPDAKHATVTINGKEESLVKVLNDDAWIKTDFITSIQQRGFAVFNARGLSSAMSAAKAIGDHIHDWWFGTEGVVTSMGVPSDGSYNIPQGVFFSFPVTISNKGEYSIVQGLQHDSFGIDKLSTTYTELREEAGTAAHLTGCLANHVPSKAERLQERILGHFEQGDTAAHLPLLEVEHLDTKVNNELKEETAAHLTDCIASHYIPSKAERLQERIMGHFEQGDTAAHLPLLEVKHLDTNGTNKVDNGSTVRFAETADGLAEATGHHAEPVLMPRKQSKHFEAARLGDPKQAAQFADHTKTPQAEIAKHLNETSSSRAVRIQEQILGIFQHGDTAAHLPLL